MVSVCTSKKSEQLLCCYSNQTQRIQVGEIKFSTKDSFEKVIFPGERFLFEAPMSAELSVYTNLAGEIILLDRILCSTLAAQSEPITGFANWDLNFHQVLSQSGILSYWIPRVLSLGDNINLGVRDRASIQMDKIEVSQLLALYANGTLAFPPLDLSGAELFDVNLTGVGLAGSNLQKAYLPYSNLNKAHLSGVQLQKANLSNAKLNGANLVRANLENADLFLASLENADLSGANLTGANLEAVNLSGANLSGANLTKTTFRRANLRGVNLTEAIFNRTDLYRARNLDVSSALVDRLSIGVHGLPLIDSYC